MQLLKRAEQEQLNQFRENTIDIVSASGRRQLDRLLFQTPSRQHCPTGVKNPDLSFIGSINYSI